MSRGIILYQSKYGATKKYVDWLVEELGYDYAETKNYSFGGLYEKVCVCIFDLGYDYTDCNIKWGISRIRTR